jgi:4-hydroxy-tetrahydrodipicolinate synthase
VITRREPMSTEFTGMHWMLATPFDDDEALDTGSIPRLVAKARDVGCNGLVALGVTGEAARLTDRERRTVAEAVVASAEGMPVTLGTSAASTQVAIAYSKEAQSLGAAAVMVAAPPMPKPNMDALLVHYQRIAEAVDLPIVVQDYPRVTGVVMPVPFIVRLAEEIPSARYLKLEDPPTPTKIRAIREFIGDRMGIFGGLGGVFLLDELAQGSAGAMTGFAYPEVLVDVCRHMAEGDRAKAEEVFHRHLPLILFESQEGIGLTIRKEALHHRGLIGTPRVRHPGGPVGDSTRQELLHLIDTLGL